MTRATGRGGEIYRIVGSTPGWSGGLGRVGTRVRPDRMTSSIALLGGPLSPSTLATSAQVIAVCPGPFRLPTTRQDKRGGKHGRRPRNRSARSTARFASRSLPRGDDHSRATELLEAATPDGRDLTVRVERLLGLKDTAHYGAALVAQPSANLADSLGTTARQSSTGGARAIGAATVSASALRDRLTGISPFSARRPEQKYVILGWFSGCAFWTALSFKRHLRFGPEPSIRRAPTAGRLAVFCVAAWWLGPVSLRNDRAQPGAVDVAVRAR